MKKTQAEKYSEIPMEKIMRMSGQNRKELEKYVRTMRMGYNRRVQSFAKKGLVSHAQIAFEGASTGARPVQLTKLTRNQLILEFAKYAKFFSNITSSERGIKKVNREQDIRIFGKADGGRPKRTMTSSEREKFWSLYEEFNNQNPTATSRYGSESIQQQIAEAIFSPQELSGENLIDLLDRVEKSLSEKSTAENLRSVPNVYSGRGNPFQ